MRNREIMARPDGVSALAGLLGVDPGELIWPQEFVLDGARGPVAGVHDPHHRLVTLYDPEPVDLVQLPPDICRRVCLVVRVGAAASWRQHGCVKEATVAGYWPDGAEAEFWVRAPGPVAVVEWPDMPAVAGTTAPWPVGWVCRPAQVDDAAAITALMTTVFSACPVPADPGVVRYALASEKVHARVVVDQAGRLVACASAEFAADGGAAEIVDCATLLACRGRGVMSRLLDALRADLGEVFGLSRCFALAREDEPAMHVVLARNRWRRTGWLTDHFRLDGRWVSAAVWVAPRFPESEELSQVD